MFDQLGVTHMVQILGNLFSPSPGTYERKTSSFHCPIYYQKGSTIIFTPVTDLTSSDAADIPTLGEIIEKATHAGLSLAGIQTLMWPIVQERPAYSGVPALPFSSRPRNHWVTLHYDVGTRKASLIDSFMSWYSLFYDCNAILALLTSALTPLNLTVDAFEVVYQGVQVDIWSCGYWTALNLKDIAKTNRPISAHTERLHIKDVFFVVDQIHRILYRLPSQRSARVGFFTDDDKSRHDSVAVKIQRIFKTLQLEKNSALNCMIQGSQNAPLLSGLQLRFQCMRAVVAAKFAIKSAIHDEVQANVVEQRIGSFATQYGIEEVSAVVDAFKNIMLLSKSIQAPYRNFIWSKQPTRDKTELLLGVYQQLHLIALENQVKVSPIDLDKPCTSDEVLSLARKMIEKADSIIVESLTMQKATDPDLLMSSITTLLKNYMTPSELLINHAIIEKLAYGIDAITRGHLSTYAKAL